MNRGLHRVVITGTGSFLPNGPVPYDRLDAVLGYLDDAPPRVRKFIENIGPEMLQGGGIERRHFAIDPETHRLTHTNATLAEEAARRALAAAGRQPQDVELLLLSCPAYDYSTPPTSTLLQERLGIESCAEMEVHSNCSGVGKTVQIAFDALRLGRFKTALVVYSQLSSVYLRNCYLNQAKLNKRQAALRYILADGSGALFLEAVRLGNWPDVEAGGNPGDAAVPHEILGTYIESVGGRRAPGMTAGAGVADLIEPSQCQAMEVFDRGSHHLDQDFSAVSQEAVPFLVQGVQHMLAALGRKPGDRIDHYIYSIPGRQLYEANLDKVTRPFGATADQVKFRAAHTGYCGGASVLLHFDEMVRSGELKPGQTAVVYSVESSKWMSGGFLVRW